MYGEVCTHTSHTLSYHSQLADVPWTPPSEYSDEIEHISKPHSFHWLDGQAIIWAVSTSTERSLIEHSIQVLAGLSRDFEHVDILKSLLQPVQRSLISCLKVENLQYDQNHQIELQ